MTRGTLRRCAPVALAGLIGGCYLGVDQVAATGSGGGADEADDGTSPDTGEPDDPSGACGSDIEAATRSLSRLSGDEYQNTMRELLGDPGFVGEYTAVEDVITLNGARQLRDGAEAALARREHWTRPVFACDLSGPADDACVDALIDDFAPRAFRRPLRDDERAWLRAIYDDAMAADGLSFADAMEIAFQQVVQAPAFVYFYPHGQDVDGLPADLKQLDDYEMASRLSYFLWASMPDDALFTAAAQGQLVTEEGLTEQVDRMLDDPRVETRLQAFFRAKLHLDQLDELDKDTELFDEFGPALVDAMRTETDALVARVYRDGGGVDDVLTSRDAYVNGALARLYGVADGPADDDTWAWVELPADQRSGLLTRAAFLSVFAGPRIESPIRRGATVLIEVLCFPPVDPPPNANDQQPQGGDAQTLREEVESRTQGAECSGCHDMINPLGFAFGHYDALGRWQDDELQSGFPVDSSADVISEGIGKVADAIELSERLREVEAVDRCIARQMFEQALGTPIGDEPRCDVEQSVDDLVAGGSFRELVRAIVLSPAFRHVALADEGEGN